MCSKMFTSTSIAIKTSNAVAASSSSTPLDNPFHAQCFSPRILYRNGPSIVQNTCCGRETTKNVGDSTNRVLDYSSSTSSNRPYANNNNNNNSSNVNGRRTLDSFDDDDNNFQTTTDHQHDVVDHADHNHDIIRKQQHSTKTIGHQPVKADDNVLHSPDSALMDNGVIQVACSNDDSILSSVNNGSYSCVTTPFTISLPVITNGIIGGGGGGDKGRQSRSSPIITLLDQEKQSSLIAGMETAMANALQLSSSSSSTNYVTPSTISVANDGHQFLDPREALRLRLSSSRDVVTTSHSAPTHQTRPSSAAAAVTSAFIYSCKLCDRTFDNASTLNVHYTHTHRDKPQYDCEVCGAAFAVKRELATHRRSHDGKPTHRCQWCQKEFGTKQLLRKHEQWHTGQRTHVCPKCNKAFFQKGHLTQHLSIHAGRRPHVCNMCSKTFIFKFDLNRHMKIHAERTSFTGTHKSCSTSSNESLDHRSSNYDESRHSPVRTPSRSSYNNGNDYQMEEDSCDSSSAKLCSSTAAIIDQSTSLSTGDHKINVDSSSNAAFSSNIFGPSNASSHVDQSSPLIISHYYNNLNEFRPSNTSTGTTSGIFANANQLTAALHAHLQNLQLSRLLGPLVFAPHRQSFHESINSMADTKMPMDLENSSNITGLYHRDDSQQHDSDDTGINTKTSPSSGGTFSDGSPPRAPSSGLQRPSITVNEASCICNENGEATCRLPPSKSIVINCPSCTKYKLKLETSLKHSEELQSILNDKEREIANLKRNVQHVGRLAGYLFKTCAEYESVWAGYVNDEIRSKLNSNLSNFLDDLD